MDVRVPVSVSVTPVRPILSAEAFISITFPEMHQAICDLVGVELKQYPSTFIGLYTLKENKAHFGFQKPGVKELLLRETKRVNRAFQPFCPGGTKPIEAVSLDQYALLFYALWFCSLAAMVVLFCELVPRSVFGSFNGVMIRKRVQVYRNFYGFQPQ